VSPFEVAIAFGTLANNGIRVAPRAITGIVNRDEEIVTRESLAFTQAISPQDAYTITSMMETVMNWGTAWRVRTHGFTRPAAGKTGTTNDFGDAWFMGYTPDLLAVVWVGFDRRQPLRLAGGQAALPIWTEFMKRALEGQPDLDFVRPAQDPLKPVSRFVADFADAPPQPRMHFPVRPQELDSQAPISAPTERLSRPSRANGHAP
jgi:membrane carboxypeptidase/penicillin-binding protein